MSPIRIGFIGLSDKGWAAIASAPPLLAPVLSSKYTITAVSTRSETSAKAAAETWSEKTGHNVKAFFGDPKHIANDPEVDLVAVSVKAPEHYPNVMPVIAAGKDFFLEWPLGKNLEEAKEIAEATKAKGVRGLIGLQGVLSPYLQKIKEIIASGVIGQVRSTSAIAYFSKDMGFWGPLTNERITFVADATNGATLSTILNGHFMAYLTHVLGPFASVSAITHQHYPTTAVIDAAGNPTGDILQNTGPSSLAFSGLLQSGVVVSCHWRGGYNTVPGRKDFLWEIDGEDGVISLVGEGGFDSLIQIARPMKLFLNGAPVDLGNTNEENFPPNALCGKNWLEFAKGPEGNYPTVDDALKVHILVDAIERSAREGKKVDIVY